MTRLWTEGEGEGEGETITVRLGERGWPVEFTWQGRPHAVQLVRQRWQVDTDWWTDRGRVWREYLALTTTDGLLCVVYFDLLDQTWHLSSVYD